MGDPPDGGGGGMSAEPPPGTGTPGPSGFANLPADPLILNYS